MNRLSDASSPYLLLHKDNPVDWYPWGPEAFAEAEAKNKPILLSIGYTSCHWCHVMNKESFADAETAKLMNDLYVCIKVDREERPDVDQIYQAAATTLGNAGGWPLTMFLTPKGLPFFAATYLPIEARGGAPAFKTVLTDVEKIHREKPDAAAETSQKVHDSLQLLWNRNTSGNVDNLLIETASVRIGQKYDIFFGGITGTPKFPNPPFVEVLWRAYLRTGSSQYLQLAGTTLDQVCLGGLQDHIGGGFFRYCTDERWVRPHFEKMLPDNALLIDIMTLVWQFNRNGLCQNAVRYAVEWMLRDMKVGDAFAASVDADSEGEEGKYYLWTEAEVDAALTGTFVQRFKSAYNVRREGEYIGGTNILNRLGAAAPYPLPQADETLLEKQRGLLLAARSKRVAPMRDDKVLADWNGFAIAALTNAGMVFKNGAWVSTAIAAFDFIVKAMGEGDRLYHSWRDGKRGPMGNADDYASMARAALTLFEATGERRYIDLAKRWTHTLNEHFWDATNGGYFFKADDSDQLFVRSRMMFDQPTPAANSLMMGVLTRLNAASGEQAYFERAQAIAVAFAAEAQRAWISMPSYFNNVEFMSLATHIVVIGSNDSAKTHELASAVWGRSFPNRFIQMVSSSDELPEGHPAKGKPMINGAPTAYICQRQVCSPGVTNPVQLSQILTLPQQRQPQQQAAQ